MSTSASLPDMRHTIQKSAIQSHSQAHRSSVIPRIRLPDPPSLCPSLIAVGAEERLAKEMDRAYNARSLELRSYYENSITNAFTALADSPFALESEKIMDTLANIYLTKIKSWIEDGVAAYKSAQKQFTGNAGASRCANPRRVFNTDYVPFLEYFFVENPFPSHADKACLAKKSGMTYRQIHVWNRRNRTKKLTTSLRTKSICKGGTSTLSSPRDHVGKYTTRGEQSSFAHFRASHSSQFDGKKPMRKECSSKTAPRCLPTSADSNVLDRYDAPLHAFPSSYPPACAYEPFPECRGQLFLAFQWARRPNHDPPSQSSRVDISALADRFSLLNVRDLSSKRSQIICGTVQDSLTATSSISVRPPSAPHPALIQPTGVVSSFVPRPPFPIVRAPQSAPPRAFISSTILSRTSHSENTISSGRKILSLPKRHPHQSPLLSRNVTPATSDTSPTPSPCPSLFLIGSF